MYKIDSISSEKWIFIFWEDSFYEPDSFIALVKAYQLQLNGKVFAVSEDMQYSITNDPLNLIFQWDDLIGITVIVPRNISLSDAKLTMQKICDTLNAKTDKQKELTD